MEKKKVSVIVPLYNTEDYIKRCLFSICGQTYKNLEILVVDDGSKDSSAKLVEECIAEDKRITLLKHTANKGLYHARITGVEKATGDYICFVDSDDYISNDFIRTLVYKSLECDADVVVGKTIHEDESGYRYVHNMYHFYDFGIIEGKDILRKYWEQEGRCFIWHTIWNKLYSRKIWDKALPILKKQDKHLIMTEDFAFSSVIMNFAERLTAADYGAYFYFQHGGASTSTKAGYVKFEKNIGDLKTAFDFVLAYITSDSYKLKVTDKFEKWSDLYSFFWTENVQRSPMSEPEMKKAMNLLRKALPEYGNEIHDASYFYNVSTAYDNRYNDLIRKVTDEETAVLSLDIFDTAVMRPFYNPTDLFYFLDEKFKEIAPNERRSFHKLRVRAEKLVRDKVLYCKRPSQDDITLDQIYDKISEISEISTDKLDILRKEEEKLEIRYCYRRKSIYNLYEAALHCGKKVYFTSDMYLSSETIKGILDKNGYKKYDGLLVSSEEDASKRTGKLYKVLIDKTKAVPESIMHLGDNWDTDVTRAQEKKIDAHFYPSALNCILYNISDIKTTHSCCPFKEPTGNMFNYEKAVEFLGTRSALAVAANRIYDDPYICFNEWTEVNCSPSFLGGYALGMHILGFVKWFTDKAIEEKYDRLLFIARDGYLPMKAYEILKSAYSDAPEAVYLYTSRKAGFAAGIKHEEELFSLYENIDAGSCTIKKFLELIAPVTDKVDEKSMHLASFDENDVFKDYADFCRFIRFIIRNGYSKQKNDSYQSKLKEYFTPFLSGKTACVDIGYSGRTQEVLHRVTGDVTDAFYVHTNDGNCAECSRENGFRVFSYYDATPSITGGAREVLFSKCTPSCTGYDTEGEEVKPIFEKDRTEFPTRFVIEETHRAVLQFVSDFTEFFGDSIKIMEMRSSDVSYPYEYFLSTLTDADSKMFSCIAFEDDMWAGRTMTLSDYWKECIRYHKIMPYYMQDEKRVEYVERLVEQPYSEGDMEYKVYIRNGLDKKSLLKKAMYWYVVDKNFFKKRVSDYRSNKK